MLKRIALIIAAVLLTYSSVTLAGESLLTKIGHLFQSKPLYTDEHEANQYFADHYETNGKNTFIFDPKHLVWAVYDKEGKKVGAGKGVGGKDFCPDIKEPCRTVEGKFAVFRKEDADCSSKTFPIDEGGGAPMPHCMFFHKGYAIHGSNSLPNHNASHGCIRVRKKAAEWMNENYINNGSTVIVLPYA